ncbi:MAG: hypothetical protein LBD20_04750 [Spirochaetaceae bacterium]|jgi:hypothetical protein|nr:hypothetical protein [Spirochaetaceae bacterium]
MNKKLYIQRAVLCVIFLCITAGIITADEIVVAAGIVAEGSASDSISYNHPDNTEKTFPKIYYAETVNDIKAREAQIPFGASTKAEADKNQMRAAAAEKKTQAENAAAAVNTNESKPEQKQDGGINLGSVLQENDILAFYGHPNSKNMGILGRHTKSELLERLNVLAAEYKEASGGRNITKAFHIIYGTCWPEGEIGIINRDKLQEYIDFAAENDMLIFLDHQIGKYDPVKSLERMLPYLKYPNVHLALDPEWRTTKPMLEIGSVTADEVNRAQQAMQDYITKNNIQGDRILILHQFNYVMIKNRRAVKSDFENVRVVLCMDGHGTPQKKRGTYAFNAEATNIPIKAFKLFLNEKGNTGVDTPLLTPKEVYGLNPRPYIIMYQ